MREFHFMLDRVNMQLYGMNQKLTGLLWIAGLWFALTIIGALILTAQP